MAGQARHPKGTPKAGQFRVAEPHLRTLGIKIAKPRATTAKTPIARPAPRPLGP